MISVSVCLILIWVVIEDMRRFRVPNVAVLLLVAGFGLECLLGHRVSLLGPHALFAGVGLLVLFAAFALGTIGGGDAKLLTAALFWVGPEGLLVFALLLLVCTVVYAAGAWLGWLASRKAGSRTVIPFGPSVAVAWVAYIGLSAWI